MRASLASLSNLMYCLLSLRPFSSSRRSLAVHINFNARAASLLDCAGNMHVFSTDGIMEDESEGTSAVAAPWMPFEDVTLIDRDAKLGGLAMADLSREAVEIRLAVLAIALEVLPALSRADPLPEGERSAAAVPDSAGFVSGFVASALGLL